MGVLSSTFFAWLQGADFYIDAHRAAVGLLPPGEGGFWLDVGCGPGLVTRLASQRGYRALGVDADPAMVRAARRSDRSGACRFAVGDLSALGRLGRADVVSAASLLFVLPDPALGLARLWERVRPGGTLLVVETTPEMRPERARRVARTLPTRRRVALSLWARARGGRALDRALFGAVATASARRHVLLDGLLEAWALEKAAT